MSFSIALDECVTLNGVSSLREQVLDALNVHDEVELDASSLVEADLSLIQLIEASRAHAAAKDKILKLTTPATPPLAALLVRAGFVEGVSEESIQFWFHGAVPQ